jgi:hypothetical protein
MDKPPFNTTCEDYLVCFDCPIAIQSNGGSDQPIICSLLDNIEVVLFKLKLSTSYKCIWINYSIDKLMPCVK